MAGRRHQESQHPDATSHFLDLLEVPLMAPSRKTLAQRTDERRAALAADPRVRMMETDLAALRVQRDGFRDAWHVASKQSDRWRGKATVYRRAARRRYRVMLRLAEGWRKTTGQLNASHALISRIQERRRDADRFIAELRRERDRYRDRCKSRTAERNAAEGGAQAARNALGEALRELDATRRAKAENDERFQLEAARARAERDQAREELAHDQRVGLERREELRAQLARENGERQ